MRVASGRVLLRTRVFNVSAGIATVCAAIAVHARQVQCHGSLVWISLVHWCVLNVSAGIATVCAGIAVHACSQGEFGL